MGCRWLGVGRPLPRPGGRRVQQAARTPRWGRRTSCAEVDVKPGLGWASCRSDGQWRGRQVEVVADGADTRRVGDVGFGRAAGHRTYCMSKRPARTCVEEDQPTEGVDAGWRQEAGPPVEEERRAAGLGVVAWEPREGVAWLWGRAPRGSERGWHGEAERGRESRRSSSMGVSTRWVEPSGAGRFNR